VAGQIIRLAGDAGAALRDHAVLYRMNAQSNALEYAFGATAYPTGWWAA
jgi:hypothetical protein